MRKNLIMTIIGMVVLVATVISFVNAAIDPALLFCSGSGYDTEFKEGHKYCVAPDGTECGIYEFHCKCDNQSCWPHINYSDCKLPCVEIPCIKEGESTTIFECCEGLKQLVPKDRYEKYANDSCEIPPGWTGPQGGICSDCGNNICEEWESRCNCPEDCEEKYCEQDDDCILVIAGCNHCPLCKNYKLNDEEIIAVNKNIYSCPLPPKNLACAACVDSIEYNPNEDAICVNNECTKVSKSTYEECNWRPTYQDYGTCAMLIGVYYNGEKCVGLSGCSNKGDVIPFNSIEECEELCEEEINHCPIGYEWDSERQKCIITPEPTEPGEETNRFNPNVAVWFKLNVKKNEAINLIESFSLSEYKLSEPGWDEESWLDDIGGMVVIRVPSGSEQEYIQKFKEKDIVKTADLSIVYEPNEQTEQQKNIIIIVGGTIILIILILYLIKKQK